MRIKRIYLPILIIASCIFAGYRNISAEEYPRAVLWSHGFSANELKAANTSLSEEAAISAELPAMVSIGGLELLAEPLPPKIGELLNNDVKLVVYLYSTQIAKEAIRNGTDVGCLERGEPLYAHPKFIETMRDYAERVAIRVANDPILRKSVYGFWLIDEPEGSIARTDLAPKKRATYLNKVAAGFKQTYGYGKFDFPQSSLKTNSNLHDALKYASYLRWWDDRLYELQKTVSDTLKKHLPETRIISSDFYFSGDVAWIDPYRLSAVVDEFLCVAYSWIEGSKEGRGVLNPGFAAKYLSDLTGKPVWVHPQLIDYQGVLAKGNPLQGDISKRIKQVFRFGGHGVFLYAYECYKPEYPRYIRNTSPSKWAEIAESLRDISEEDSISTNKEPKTGIFVSNHSVKSRLDTDTLYWAFTLLSHSPAEQFNFISDTQLLNNPDVLKGFEVLLVPQAAIVTSDVAGIIEKYVHSGGNIVLFDPEAFHWSPDGNELRTREKLTGAKGFTKAYRGLLNSTVRITSEDSDRQPVLRVNEPIFYRFMGLTKSIEILGRFVLGEPAIIRSTYGSGKVIALCFNPLKKSLSIDLELINKFLDD